MEYKEKSLAKKHEDAKVKEEQLKELKYYEEKVLAQKKFSS